MLIRNIIRFIAVLAAQVLLFSNIYLGPFIFPVVYVYFILMLPFETKGWLLLTSAFFMGLAVDIFSSTPGLNAAASVMMAFFRPAVITLLSRGKDIVELQQAPNIRTSGFAWYFTYTLLLVLVHHTTLFFLEVFTFAEVGQTLLRIVLSSLTTVVLIILIQLLFTSSEP